MLTKEEIEEASAKVKSGADFPQYVQDLKSLGVWRYTYLVANGTTTYQGKHGDSLTTTPLGETKQVMPLANKVAFRQALHHHQRGNTDFATFCQQAADAGIARWVTNLRTMQVVYFDEGGYEVLSERVVGR